MIRNITYLELDFGGGLLEQEWLCLLLLTVTNLCSYLLQIEVHLIQDNVQYNSSVAIIETQTIAFWKLIQNIMYLEHSFEGLEVTVSFLHFFVLVGGGGVVEGDLVWVDPSVVEYWLKIIVWNIFHQNTKCFEFNVQDKWHVMNWKYLISLLESSESLSKSLV